MDSRGLQEAIEMNAATMTAAVRMKLFMMELLLMVMRGRVEPKCWQGWRWCV
jgi:hypothetical protein